MPIKAIAWHDNEFLSYSSDATQHYTIVDEKLTLVETKQGWWFPSRDLKLVDVRVIKGARLAWNGSTRYSMMAFSDANATLLFDTESRDWVSASRLGIELGTQQCVYVYKGLMHVVSNNKIEIHETRGPKLKKLAGNVNERGFVMLDDASQTFCIARDTTIDVYRYDGSLITQSKLSRPSYGVGYDHRLKKYYSIAKDIIYADGSVATYDDVQWFADIYSSDVLSADAKYFVQFGPFGQTQQSRRQQH